MSATKLPRATRILVTTSKHQAEVVARQHYPAVVDCDEHGWYEVWELTRDD